MLARSIRKLIAVTALAGAVHGAPVSGQAAEITFLCAEALQPAVDLLLPDFQKAHGHTVNLSYANIGSNTARVRSGDRADLAIVAPAQWDSLQKEAKIDADIRTLIGRIGVGVFVKRGASRPDVSSVEAFRNALANAKSIALRDPKHGSPVGQRILALFDRLGLSDVIKPKLRMTVDRPYEEVLSNGAEFGFSTMSEILASPAVDLVGPIPSVLQDYISFVAAIPTPAKEKSAARQLVEFLRSPQAIAVLRSKGVDID